MNNFNFSISPLALWFSVCIFYQLLRESFDISNWIYPFLLAAESVFASGIFNLCYMWLRNILLGKEDVLRIKRGYNDNYTGTIGINLSCPESIYSIHVENVGEIFLSCIIGTVGEKYLLIAVALLSPGLQG